MRTICPHEDRLCCPGPRRHFYHPVLVLEDHGPVFIPSLPDSPRFFCNFLNGWYGQVCSHKIKSRKRKTNSSPDRLCKVRMWAKNMEVRPILAGIWKTNLSLGRVTYRTNGWRSPFKHYRIRVFFLIVGANFFLLNRIKYLYFSISIKARHNWFLGTHNRPIISLMPLISLDFLALHNKFNEVMLT